MSAHDRYVEEVDEVDNDLLIEIEVIVDKLDEESDAWRDIHGKHRHLEQPIYNADLRVD